MKFATVRDLKNRTSEMLRKAAAGTEVLITSHGRPVAVLHGLTEDELEDYVLTHHPELRASLEQAEKDLREGRGSTLEEVMQGIRARARREKRGKGRGRRGR